MRNNEPPRSATRLLEDFGPKNNQEALAGDLLEAFQQGRSRTWYWRQVLAAIQWRRQFLHFLLWMALASFLASLDFHAGSTEWLADLAALIGLGILSRCLPAVLSFRGRALLFLSIVVFALLQPYFTGNIVPEHFPWYLLPLSLIFYRKPKVMFWTFCSGFSVPDFHAGSVRSLLALTAIGTVYFVLDFLRTRLSGLWKACLWLLLVAGSFFSAFFNPYFVPIFFSSIWILLSVERLAPSRPVPLIELLKNDADAERRRMIANIEETMAEEESPELRETYEAAIARLRDEDPAPPGIA